ncbi:MAG: UDP-N-acetylmuramoyl-tripeptide--D-alanyl-D-alanine ligase [Lachnospiraceae bacterium]|nr:UDP-N-acetylmuramoyl-tripeptide--D-alanyl-D-alanine ligase [Lachnospiraceae bacterium]
MREMTVKEIAAIVGGIIEGSSSNVTVTGFSTNSKEGDEHTLFIPVIGERVDAHDFIKDAYANGMRAAFWSREEINQDVPDMVYIKVDNTVDALQRLGAWYKDQFLIPVVGITGSVGKTTTKEMIAAALETKYNVLKTSGNMNGQIGLPQMMCRLMPEHDIAVIEMGMSIPGEMEKLTPIAKPETVVMTNIGVSHIGQLKTQENIRKEKLNIVNAFSKDSTLLVNGDDHLLNEIYEEFGKDKSADKENTQSSVKIEVSDATNAALELAQVYTFGLKEGCTFYADQIEIVGEQTHFTFHANYPDAENGMKSIEERVVLSVLGNHNVSNALAALAVAMKYGIEPCVAKKGLEAYRPISMRGGIRKVNGITVIDDTYNASPDSMKSAIDVLTAISGVKRRIAVLADILELGELSESCHRQVGEYIATQPVDEVITIGTEAAAIMEGIKEHNSGIKVAHYDTREQAKEALEADLASGDAIVFKGSRGMKLDQLVNDLFEKEV